MTNNFRKKDSAKLTWDTKPKRASNPKDIEFQTVEVVIPNPEKAGQLSFSFRDKLMAGKYGPAVPVRSSSASLERRRERLSDSELLEIK